MDKQKIIDAIERRIWEKLKQISEIDSKSDAASAQEDLIDENIKGLKFALRVVQDLAEEKEVQGE